MYCVLLLVCVLICRNDTRREKRKKGALVVCNAERHENLLFAVPIKAEFVPVWPYIRPIRTKHGFALHCSVYPLCQI